MALIDNFHVNAKPSQPDRGRSFGAEVFQTIGLALSALAAGWRAAIDYEQLNRRSDRELRGRGISRDRLAEEIERRHFDGIGTNKHR